MMDEHEILQSFLRIMNENVDYFKDLQSFDVTFGDADEILDIMLQFNGNKYSINMHEFVEVLLYVERNKYMDEHTFKKLMCIDAL